MRRKPDSLAQDDSSVEPSPTNNVALPPELLIHDHAVHGVVKARASTNNVRNYLKTLSFPCSLLFCPGRIFDVGRAVAQYAC